ncbi:hypothetical protein LUZ62_052968 [Rhynchospora pubera]|uniref:J domain-containing protein n=1 Tax=Rhynchospora pubera TaxID=906938 RepID=A0AAV8GGW4_9POAL|nr:hypothetical protein LUZ62_052968 [Rhynchospora pubera]
MECKKEGAVHAKEIAEKRLLKQDYAGAKAMALKAKKLFPLDNICQLLAVCEVHCSAQLMANGLYDWYKIIQVEPLSDEIMIRKQYHKLVALLHPDKNKIPGAEAAFKLVGEANNILSDQAKRIMYDLKRKHLVRSAGPHQSTETTATPNSSSNLNRANKWQPHQQFTFWTECPGCKTRHQYNRNILSHIVCCTHCSSNFIANSLSHLNAGHMDGAQSPQKITETNSAHNSSSNLNGANKWRAQQQHQPQPHQGLTFMAECPSCGTLHQYYSNMSYNIVCCTHCSKRFRASAASNLKPGHMDGDRNEPQQFNSLREPQKSDICRFTCDRGVGGTTMNITAGVRKPDSNPNPTSMSNSSCPNTITGQMRGKRFSMDRSQNPSPCSIPNLNFDYNQIIGDREGIDGGAHAAGTGTPLRRSPCNKPDVKNNAEPGCSSPAKIARVTVKGVRDGNCSASAANTNTSASTCVEGVVKEQERDEEKEQVEPSGFLEKNNTDFKPIGSAEDKVTASKKARLEVNGVPDGNGSVNATNTNTSATTCVEGVMREQNREKEKGMEQLQPSGFLKEKDTAFKPSASVEGSGATYKKAKVEVDGMPDSNGSANATNINTSASSRAGGEVKELDGEKEKEKEQVEPNGLLENGNTSFKPSRSAEDNCATSKKASLEVEGVQDGNGSANIANTSASILVEGRVKEHYRGTARIFTDNELPHLNLGNQPQQFTGQKQPQQSDSYRFTYVRRVRGTARDTAEGVTKPDENCLSMSKSNNPNTVNGQMTKSVSADTSQKPYPCSEPDLSLDVNKRRGNADETGSGNHSAGTSKPLRRSSRNRPDVKYNGTGISNPAKKARGEVKGEQDGNSLDTSRCLRGSSRYKPDVKYNGTCVSSPAKKPNDDAEKLYVYPDPDFHKFNMCRTCNKFQQGNIWALYSDLDTFPKYYGLICKVEYEPFQVHINWLKACPKSDVETAWLGANLPISCGKFRVTTQHTIYDKPDYFSHMVRHHDRSNYYEILPEVGEVWAIYKNWSAGWMPCDFKTSKFDIVEVIENREQSTIVCPLRQVPEYTSVFMSDEVDGAGSGAWEVPASAYILFSHKIPAIRLKDECGGKLEGFWELDPASVP